MNVVNGRNALRSEPKFWGADPGYDNLAREHPQTAAALQTELDSYTKQPVDLAQRRRELLPVPPLVRVFMDGHGGVMPLRDEEDDPTTIASLDLSAARINALISKTRGGQGPCADPQPARRRRDDSDARSARWCR